MKHIEFFIKIAKESFLKRHKETAKKVGYGLLAGGAAMAIGGHFLSKHKDKIIQKGKDVHMKDLEQKAKEKYDINWFNNENDKIRGRLNRPH